MAGLDHVSLDEIEKYLTDASRFGGKKRKEKEDDMRRQC